jgi:hypothetical protein
MSREYVWPEGRHAREIAAATQDPEEVFALQRYRSLRSARAQFT